MDCHTLRVRNDGYCIVTASAARRSRGRMDLGITCAPHNDSAVLVEHLNHQLYFHQVIRKRRCMTHVYKFSRANAVHCAVVELAPVA